MNFITVAGRVGKDPETRFLDDGTAILSFSVADDQGKDKPAVWWNCGLFGKRAESLAPYITKGTSLTVVGNVTEREYTDKDGQQRKAMSIRVSDLALQGSRSDASATPAQRQAPAPARVQQPVQRRPQGVPADFGPDNDIPF